MDTKVLIGVATAEYARRADWYDYFNQLEKPLGTVMTFVHGQSPARNRNLVVDMAMANDCSHVLFVDDDVVMKPDALKKLLAHDKDIVSGLYLMRNYPHQPIAFDNALSDGRCLHSWLHDGKKGLIPVVAAGLGCLLIKIEVFKKIEKPYIRLGQLEKDHWCDDIDFCLRCRAAGIQAYLDLDVPVGHQASVTLWPLEVNGKWQTVYDTKGTDTISIPQVAPSKETIDEHIRKEELAGVK